MKTGILISIMAALLNVAVLAGGSDESIITIKDFKFIPPEITIKKGQTIRWENQEKRQYHSVWFEALGEEEPEDYLFPDDVYERSFSEPGTYPYRCGPHPKMLGTVIVTD